MVADNYVVKRCVEWTGEALMTKRMSIGLDIGSSAVRAAEVMIDGDRKVLRRFAQVGLPAGAVIEGEVRDREAVAAAIKRLWQHGRFSRQEGNCRVGKPAGHGPPGGDASHAGF